MNNVDVAFKVLKIFKDRTNILITTTWMEPEGIMLSEISPREKYCMISFIYGI